MISERGTSGSALVGVGAVMVTLAGVACGGGARPAAAPAPAPVPAPAGTPAPPVADAPAAAVERFGYLPGAAAYDVRAEATVELEAGPEPERGREVVRSAARVGYTLSPVGPGFAVAGQVEGYAVEASDRVRGGGDAAAVTVRFAGTLDPRSTRLYADGLPASCASPAGAAQIAALASARETVLWVPANVARGARWRDSVSIGGCRGPIPTLATTVSRYEVTEANGSRIRVRRTATTTQRGQAIVAGRTVTLTGTGTSETTIELDAMRGRLIRSDGETRSTVAVTLPDGTRQFSERVRVEVRDR